MDSKAISTANHALLVQNDPLIVSHLLRTTINRLQRDEYGSTALHLAAREGNIVLITMLLDTGIHVNTSGENGWTPLHEALSQRQINACQYLMARGADPSIKNDHDETVYELSKRCNIPEDITAQCLDTECVLTTEIEELENLSRQHYRQPLTSHSDTTLVSGIINRRRSEEAGQLLTMDNGSRSTLAGIPTNSTSTSTTTTTDSNESSRFRFQSVKPKRVFTLLSRSVVGRRRSGSIDG
ncbi:ankyrin repeat-containing domain protein [Syncephalis plumigaleata]|nr:ankyrin repeat-containing domain protein [Syncephalis plumigaleata]